MTTERTRADVRAETGRLLLAARDADGLRTEREARAVLADLVAAAPVDVLAEAVALAAYLVDEARMITGVDPDFRALPDKRGTA